MVNNNDPLSDDVLLKLLETNGISSLFLSPSFLLIILIIFLANMLAENIKCGFPDQQWQILDMLHFFYGQRLAVNTLKYIGMEPFLHALR